MGFGADPVAVPPPPHPEENKKILLFPFLATKIKREATCVFEFLPQTSRLSKMAPTLKTRQLHVFAALPEHVIVGVSMFLFEEQSIEYPQEHYLRT